MKTCSRCGQEKDHAEFRVRMASKDGLTAACKKCLSNSEKKKTPHDRHNIDIGPPARRQCKPIRTAVHEGCGQWKPLNEKNFREGRHICRECENRIDRERKLKHNYVDIRVGQVLQSKWI